MASLFEKLCHFSTTCDSCGGTGTIVETRDKRLDELTDLQRRFLLEGDLQREKPSEEQQREMEQMKEQANTGGHGAGPAPSTAPASTPTPNGSHHIP